MPPQAARPYQSMNASALPGPPRWRSPFALLLALLVQSAWWTLMQRTPARPQAVGDAALTAPLLWLAPPVQQASPRHDQARRSTPQDRPQQAAAVQPVSTSVLETSPASPSVAMPSPEASPADATDALTGPAARPPMPLNLALPPQRAASRAESLLGRMLNDPRANREQRGIGWAVADAADALPTTIQDATDGTGARLIRQGSKCLRVRESRARLLNPMDEQFRNAPAQVSRCVND